MKVSILSEHGHDEALLGLSLSHKADPARMPKRAEKLAGMGLGHDKFLESIAVWLDVTAPRYWWQEFDAYRVGVTKQSESTMHTWTKDDITPESFEGMIDGRVLEVLREAQAEGDWTKYKRHLPESYLQRRVVTINYKSLLNIIRQRKGHKLPEWRQFVETILSQLQHPEYMKTDG